MEPLPPLVRPCTSEPAQRSEHGRTMAGTHPASEGPTPPRGRSVADTAASQEGSPVTESHPVPAGAAQLCPLKGTLGTHMAGGPETLQEQDVFLLILTHG